MQLEMLLILIAPLLDEEFKVLYGDEALHDRITYNMRKSMNLDVDGCILLPGEKRSLQECGFNVTAKTFFIIHGWTVNRSAHTPYPLFHLLVTSYFSEPFAV